MLLSFESGGGGAPARALARWREAESAAVSSASNGSSVTSRTRPSLKDVKHLYGARRYRHSEVLLIRVFASVKDGPQFALQHAPRCWTFIKHVALSNSFQQPPELPSRRFQSIVIVIGPVITVGFWLNYHRRFASQYRAFSLPSLNINKKHEWNRQTD